MARTFITEEDNDITGQDTADGVSKAKKKPKLERAKSQQIMSRWYRAPEVILIQEYREKIDIWSAGCIFAELLNFTVDYRELVPDRYQRYLFKGGSCFPISPGCGDESKKQNGVITIEDNDQIIKIAEVIGPIKDTEFLSK